MRERIILVINRYRKYKRAIVPWGESLSFVLILVFSYWIILGDIDRWHIPQITFLVLTFIPIKIVIFWMFRLYHISFRYFSLQEIIDVLKASLVSAVILFLISMVSKNIPFMYGYPKTVVFIDFMLTFIMSSGIRFIFRLIYFPNLKDRKGERVLIVGAGSAGEELIRELKKSASFTYIPVALVDDDADKHNSIIHGVKVMGPRDKIPEIVRDFKIDDIIISIPSASSAQLKGIMDYVRKSEVKKVKIVPGLFHILTREIRIDDIRDVSIEDILGRESVNIDLEGAFSYLSGKRVLVTGAGGSIGSELCRQIGSFKPSSLIMADIGDTALFYIDREIKEKFLYLPVVSIIADVKDAIRMRDVFLRHSPQVVFHAAAYKHVPLMETNLRETVLNNIEGTRIPAVLSVESGVEKFIFISTDKAINPTSIMGATKRAAEDMLKYLNNNKKTKFISVRFGNVLESSGSVIPIFKEQVRRGGPVTVTHPDMMRYLMSITEAAYLVLQAGAMGEGKEVFVLDMGKPVRILDLAYDMIRFYGLEPDKDIPVVFTGKRPGEKLYEKLITTEENTIPTKHEKIFIVKDVNNLGPEYIENIEELIKMARDNMSRENIISLLKELVPTYQPESTKL